MAIDVNPPPQVNIPRKILEDPELRDYYIYRDEILFKLWLRTGGGNDLISETSETVNNINIDSAVSLFSTVTPNTDFYSSVKSGSYTAVNRDFVEARNKAIITLDPNAEANTQIMVANGDGSRITVMGNIKFTSLDTSMIINNMGTNIHFHKFVDENNDYWRAR